MESFTISAHDFVTEKHCELRDNYEVKEVLGEGSYGSVRKISHRLTHEDRAVKVLLKKKLGHENMQDILNEVSVLRSLDHPNILKLYECYQDKFSYCIVTELCTGGELFERITSQQHLPEAVAADYIRQILSCLLYIHEKGIVHRDLKPENFLLSDTSAMANLKLIDFGTSTHFTPGEFLTYKIGTIYYLSPEVIDRHYNEKCDIWSAGAILYTMLCGSPPFPGKKDSEIMRNIQKGTFSLTGGVWNTISAGAKDLLVKMMNKDIGKRLSAREALSHSWIRTAVEHPVNRLHSQRHLDNLESFTCGKSLQKAAFSFIASQLTSKSEREDMLELFKKLDTDSSGTLSRQEIKAGIGFFHQISEAELEKVMNQVDCDRSGEIDYSEFVTACFNKEELLTSERLSLAFNEFDTDKNGSISREELKEMLGKGKDYSEVVWNSMIEEADKNGDGVIDLEEFSELMMNFRQ